MKKILITAICLIVFIFGIFLISKNYKQKETENEKITLAEVTHSVFYTPMYVAIEKGYFKDEGIDIELLLTPGADKVSAAVLAGDAEIGFAGAESAVYIYNSNNEDYLQIFAGLTKRDGQFIISKTPNENFKLSDLIGKEILVGRISGMPALSFLNALSNNGIDTKKLTINSAIDFASLSGAFIGGTGDYVNLFEPNATLLENEGYGHVVASVGELSGDVPYTTFYSKKSFVDNNKDLLIKFTQALDKGIKYTLENNSTDIASTIINQFPDTKINDLKIMIERYKSYEVWLNNPFISEDLFKNLDEFLLKNKLINKETPYNEIINNLYKIN